jgi:hypothetical protein
MTLIAGRLEVLRDGAVLVVNSYQDWVGQDDDFCSLCHIGFSMKLVEWVMLSTRARA